LGILVLNNVLARIAVHRALVPSFKAMEPPADGDVEKCKEACAKAGKRGRAACWAAGGVTTLIAASVSVVGVTLGVVAGAWGPRSAAIISTI
jgi:hypothetical protein